MANTEVFPRRNLPLEAENWGRAVEARIIQLETALIGLQQNALSENKSAAASVTVLSRQVNDVSNLQRVVESATNSPSTNDTSDLTLWTPDLPSITGFVSRTGFVRIAVEASMTDATLQIGYFIENPTAPIVADRTVVRKFFPDGPTSAGWFAWSLSVESGGSRSRTWYAPVPTEVPLTIGLVARANQGGVSIPSAKIQVQEVPKP